MRGIKSYYDCRSLTWQGDRGGIVRASPATQRASRACAPWTSCC